MPIPHQITKGISFVAEFQFAKYPPGDYTASLELAQALGSTITITGIPDGDGFKFHASPSETGDWAGGAYVWGVKVSDGTDIFLAAQGITTVSNFAEPDDLLGARAKLESAEQELEARVKGKAINYSIQGGLGSRQLQRMSTEELMQAIQYYRRLVNEIVSKQSKGRSTQYYARIR